MATNFNFKFLPTTGELSGASFEKQIAQALNEVGEYGANAQNVAEKNTSICESANATAVDAKMIAEQALAGLEQYAISKGANVSANAMLTVGSYYINPAYCTGSLAITFSYAPQNGATINFAGTTIHINQGETITDKQTISGNYVKFVINRINLASTVLTFDIDFYFSNATAISDTATIVATDIDVSSNAITATLTANLVSSSPQGTATNSVWNADTVLYQNYPTNNAGFLTIKSITDNSKIFQYYVALTGNIYERIYQDSTFGNWIESATSQSLADYLPLAGGTISGNLTVTGDSTLKGITATTLTTSGAINAGDVNGINIVATGNASITGDANVTGNVAATNITASGNVTAPNIVTLTTAQNITGKKSNMKINEATQVLTDGTAITFDSSLGSIATLTVTQACTISVVSVSGDTLTLMLTNGGSKVITWQAIKWTEGTAPELTATGIDIITLININGTLYGTYAGGFA